MTVYELVLLPQVGPLIDRQRFKPHLVGSPEDEDDLKQPAAGGWPPDDILVLAFLLGQGSSALATTSSASVRVTACRPMWSMFQSSQTKSTISLYSETHPW